MPPLLIRSKDTKSKNQNGMTIGFLTGLQFYLGYKLIINKIKKAGKPHPWQKWQAFGYQPFKDERKNKNSRTIYFMQYKLTVVSGFSSFLGDLLIDSGITSIVPVHPTSRRSKAYSKASDSCFVPWDAKKVNESKLCKGDLQEVPPRSYAYLRLMGLYYMSLSR